MNIHFHVQQQLYDYIRRELDETSLREIEEHVRGCAICKDELDELKEFLSFKIQRNSAASEERTPEFWKNFSMNVIQSIQTRKRNEVRSDKIRLSVVWSLLNTRKRWTIAISGLLLASIVSLYLLGNVRSAKVDGGILESPSKSEQSSDLDERMGRYLRKSKVLLIGLSNLDLEKSPMIDLSTERKISEDLASEARYIEQQPVDIRTAALLNDLKNIQSELANINESNTLPRIEMVRNSINRENLLFKVRMAESMYDSHRFVKVSRNTPGNRK